MNIPGQLAKTTLGDVLGALHRAGLSGVLELIEPGGAQPHRIFVSHGLVDGVETSLGVQGLTARGAGPRGLLRERLEALFRVRAAALRFHARRLTPPGFPGCRPLAPAEFLYGRPRARDAVSSGSDCAEAYRVLGLERSASRLEVQRAFRKLARAFHPDRYPRASACERVALLQRFARLSAAYHAIERG